MESEIARVYRGSIALIFALSALAAGAAQAQERSKWTLDPGIYAFIPGMSGIVSIGPVDIDMGAPSDALLKINAVFMGNVRLGYDQFGLNLDFLYGNLNVSHGGNGIDVGEQIIEPTLSYRPLRWLEPFAGFRYDNVTVDATGPSGNAHQGVTDWFDPIIGAHLIWQATDALSVHFRGDVGGFGVGSKFTYQAFPYVDWRVAKAVSVQGGYRVLYIDYEKGAVGLRNTGTYIHYDLTELGIQFGLKFLIDL